MGVKKRAIFGIHSMTPRHLTTLKSYGIMEILGGANIETTGETEDLYGGSSRFAYASEATQMSSSATVNAKSFPNFLMQLFLGGSVTELDAAPNGEIRDFVNTKGTLKHATVGVASVGLKTGAKDDLKFGKLIIVAKDATHVDVYAVSNIDFSRGVKKDFLSDDLKIASNLTITSAGVVEVAGFGIELTGGSGTIGMTPGDVAEVEVLPPHSGASKIKVGSASAVFPAFNAIMLAAKTSTKEIFQIEAFNVVGSGMPIPMQEKSWMVADLSMKFLQSTEKDAVMEITHIGEVD